MAYDEFVFQRSNAHSIYLGSFMRFFIHQQRCNTEAMSPPTPHSNWQQWITWIRNHCFPRTRCKNWTYRFNTKPFPSALHLRKKIHGMTTASFHGFKMGKLESFTVKKMCLKKSTEVWHGTTTSCCWRSLSIKVFGAHVTPLFFGMGDDSTPLGWDPLGRPWVFLSWKNHPWLSWVVRIDHPYFSKPILEGVQSNPIRGGRKRSPWWFTFTNWNLVSM